MKISASVENLQGEHWITLKTDGKEHSIQIPPRPSGFGSSANGGELLFLALATCYCNDIYREAAKKNIQVDRVEVEVQGDFGAEGEPARNVTYRARVTARASEEQIRGLMAHTDRVAEIQNTLRSGAAVTLSEIEVRSFPEGDIHASR
jgi:organic hydroperoxide reductase OsmC/OhrA